MGAVGILIFSTEQSRLHIYQEWKYDINRQGEFLKNNKIRSGNERLVALHGIKVYLFTCQFLPWTRKHTHQQQNKYFPFTGPARVSRTEITKVKGKECLNYGSKLNMNTITVMCVEW